VIDMSDERNAFASFERKWLDANPEQNAVLVFLPPAQRGIASAYGSLIRELAQTAFSVRETQVAAAKLGWWQQELIGAAVGNPRHPISRELFRDGRADVIDAGLWRALTDGAIAQLDVSPPATFEDLLASLLDFFGPVAAIEDRLAEKGAPQSDAIAQLWACSHLVRLVENVSSSADHVMLPLDLLARDGVSRAEMLEPSATRTAVLHDFVATIRDTIEKNQRLATGASLGTRVRARIDRWLADHAIRADDPAKYLSRHARNLRWRSLWWAWREARSLTSLPTSPT
jgi:phytoene synthase